MMTAVEEGKTVGQRALKLQVSFTFMFYCNFSQSELYALWFSL